MADPVRLLLTNAAAAGLIALVAWASSRVLHRHAVVHALWLLALLKLVSPPIAPVPLLPSWTAESLGFGSGTPTVAVIPAPPAADALLRDRAAASVRAEVGRPRPAEAVRVAGPLGPSAGPTSMHPAPLHPAPARPATDDPPFDWRAVVWTVLASGALSIAGLAAWRFVRFRRLLASARAAPERVCGRASTLARQLGIRRTPRILLLPARIPPMLWPDRTGPLLLMPEGLVPDLRADELDALLAHELAHVRRRDHWVRLLEIAATALFWWYPVTWWARSALRRAEERCCDEWVLRVLPRSARAYADGLLKSLAFVADTPVPALASGLGPVEDLESRLKEILMTRPAPQLAVPLRLALAVAAVLGLAVFPTHALPRAGDDDPEKPASAAKGARPAMAPPAPDDATPAPDAVAPESVEDGVKDGIAQGVTGGARRGVPGGVSGGVPGGVRDGVRGGIAGGVPGGVPGGITAGVPAPPPMPPLTPRPALAPVAPHGLLGTPLPPAALAPLVSPIAVPRAPMPPPPARSVMHAMAPMAPLGPIPPVAALAGGPGTPRSPEQRALDEQRRSIQDQQRKLHQQELELQQKQLELEAHAEQAELKAEADRLRADGKTEEAARVEKKAQVGARRAELQKRELELEAEGAALEAKLEAETQAHQDRLEAAEKDGEQKAMEDAQREMERAEAAQEQAQQELEKKQEALQREMEEAEKQEQALEAEEQVDAMRGTTEELAQSIGEQIDSLKEAREQAPAHRAEIDREIQRLKAALDALNAGGTPKAPAAKAPRPQAPKPPAPPAKTPRP